MLTKSSSSGFGVAVLNKKIQQNPRYKDVKPVIDSGNNVKKYIDTLKESRKNNPFKPDELFKRIKLSGFVRLIMEVAKAVVVDDPVLDFGGTETRPKEAPEDETNKLSESLPPFQGVLCGIGEWDRKKEEKPLPLKKPHLSLPYLLLDVRDPEEYKSCHIITAQNYPSTMLLRSPGYETKDLLHFKNMSKKMIILYDEEEILAVHVATTLVQRGYDNIYILCGGLKLAQEKFPRGLLNGVLLHLQTRKNSMSPSSVEDQQQHIFKESFTEDDIRILELTSEMHLLSLATSKQTSSAYGSRSIAPRKSPNQRPSTDGMQRRQNTRKSQSTSSKFQPWR